ncbi:MAG: hypothetical protein ACYC5O_20865 [Anaerolineae bacterium]
MRLKGMIAAASVLALAAVVGVWLVVPALAQTATATPEAASQPPGDHGRGGGFGFGGGSFEEFDAKAEALGLTPTELFEQLHSGKTLSEIAAAQGIDEQAVQDAVTAAREQSTKDAISEAVAAGTMTQDQADWLLEGIEKGYTGGMGRFGGFGRPMGVRIGWHGQNPFAEEF